MSYIQHNDPLSIIDNQNKDFERQFGRTIGIHNRKRTGKTLSAVMLALLYLDILPYIKGVITNINLKFESLGIQDKVIPFQNIKMIKDKTYRYYLLLLDEFADICDSRLSSSYRNRFITTLLKDTGKFGQILLLTDQNASAIDKRVRNNADAVLRPEINLDTGMCDVKVLPSYQSYFEVDAYERWNQYDVSFKYSFKEYYPLYDTTQHLDRYKLTFEPEDYFEEFSEWFIGKGYDKIEDYSIKKATLTLWKESDDVVISQSQLSALLEYMKLENKLELYRR